MGDRIMFQERHHGIEIPKKDQPKCRYCSGGMSLNISYANDDCHAFWYCLDEECQNDNYDAGFEQVAFADWYQTLKNKTLKRHFQTVGKSQSELTAEALIAEGYKKVGGHNWGGSVTWGLLEGKKAWTGYKGQTLEYWQKD